MDIASVPVKGVAIVVRAAARYVPEHDFFWGGFGDGSPEMVAEIDILLCGSGGCGAGGLLGLGLKGKEVEVEVNRGSLWSLLWYFLTVVCLFVSFGCVRLGLNH